MRSPPALLPSTILIVEDHPATRSAVLALFDGVFSQCQVLVAETAEEALALCELVAPNVVIMDISLPGMNGIEATQRICQRFPNTRVVMHSSNDMQIFRDESTAAGAAAFVGKGRSSRELVAVVSRFMHISE